MSAADEIAELVLEREMREAILIQARAVFGPEYPVKTTFEVVISKQKNINTTKQSKMELNGYTAHIIAYDQPSSFAHWKHVMSTEGGRSARDAYDELLDKLRERFSAVMEDLNSGKENEERKPKPNNDDLYN